jgi:hypothetical protein
VALNSAVPLPEQAHPLIQVTVAAAERLNAAPALQEALTAPVDQADLVESLLNTLILLKPLLSQVRQQ